MNSVISEPPTESTPFPKNTVSPSPESVVRAVVGSRNAFRRLKYDLIVADENCGPMLLITVFQACFERALNGIPTRGEDLKRMLSVFFGPPQED